jgi:acetyl-CoA carboxylase biotin carboxyl carrier protein
LDIREIQRLIKMVERSEVSEFEIEEKGLKIRISKNSSHQAQTVIYAPPMPTGMPAFPTAEPSAAASVELPAPTKAGIAEIKSPMVGTFYSAPAPEADPYVRVGDHVEPGKVLCIVEAMKLMNEIEAEVAGTIVEIVPKNAESVEFDQILFRIDTSR